MNLVAKAKKEVSSNKFIGRLSRKIRPEKISTAPGAAKFVEFSAPCAGGEVPLA
jgi:hypothetical protein